jgi:hypothetical protein
LRSALTGAAHASELDGQLGTTYHSSPCPSSSCLARSSLCRNITQFVKGATIVGFGGPTGQILPLVNFGGTVAIHAGVASILHKVNAVLMQTLQ